MRTKITIAKVTALAVMIAAATLYAANRSGASGIDKADSSAPAQTEIIPATDVSLPNMPQQILRGYQRAQAEQAPLAIHGPFVLTVEELARMKSGA